MRVTEVAAVLSFGALSAIPLACSPARPSASPLQPEQPSAAPRIASQGSPSLAPADCASARTPEPDHAVGENGREEAPRGLGVAGVKPGGPDAPKGRLAPEIIQGVVRARYDEMRRCYEAGLGRNAELTGRVVVRFVIAVDGSVSAVSDAKSDIPDPQVLDCVMGVYWTLRFPEPSGGIVTVVYPILFSPG